MYGSGNPDPAPAPPVPQLCASNAVSVPSAETPALIFAVADGRVLMFGGYRSHGNLRRVVVADIEDDMVRPVREFDLVEPDGTPLDANIRVEGRGPTLHVLAGTTWSRLDVREFV